MNGRGVRTGIAIALGALLGLTSLWSAGLHVKWLVEALRGQLELLLDELGDFLRSSLPWLVRMLKTNGWPSLSPTSPSSSRSVQTRLRREASMILLARRCARSGTGWFPFLVLVAMNAGPVYLNAVFNKWSRVFCHRLVTPDGATSRTTEAGAWSIAGSA